MAAGENTHPGGTTDHGGTGTAVAVPDSEDLPLGAVVTASGRVSAAEVHQEPSRSDQPFTPVQLSRLDEALTLASRETGLRFSVYLGDLGANPTARVAELHDQLEGSNDAVLVAVSPGQRVVEVLSGAGARMRLPDRGAKLAVMSMLASFRESDLLGGLLSGLRMLADQAGGRPRAH
ncbi:DUF5130 family protein [Pseudonocardia xinjiangensis]|uniref:DUF5130 family protein n=1 Tax=Pseudonocardia xinjiangensis TaxID=75289 RepID=A0ABX1RB30_9PSEU|nr:DUF5130 family protein [Pseudonocardia xinjiangensis]